jgi:hypothetical protein
MNMKSIVPEGYEIVELDMRVPHVDPAMLTRFKWRAKRYCRKQNAKRLVDSYRFEVCDWLDGRWAVVAMQNQLRPKESLDGLTWTCHICGRTRPDAKISVYSSTKYLGDIPVQQNVRYCNDNPACVEAAPTKDFMEQK